MSLERTCPDCGSTLPADAPRGLCPHCLMGAALSAPEVSVGATLSHSPAARVLETLTETVGHVPRVLLRDTAVGEQPSPMVFPLKDADTTIRYRIDGEIARGGMGSVLKGYDPDLGRDVAVKVLRDDLRHNTDMIRRFVEEAQIGGQLQHPGVVPIYEMGTFADLRPFFSMKLVKGQTMAVLLAARVDATADLARFLTIFQAIAQTMAYAHTRGVIHRDLKPSNIMVGAFGEVQVMDWGLAKVLPRGGVVDDARAGKEPPAETMISTARSGSDTDLSRAGSVLGTPSYMAPEQARGETEAIDERADVFALGSILAEVLTGSPAFTGRGSAEIVRKAARGETAEALARLDACGAEAELIALTKDCLAVEAEDRPRDASAVAERVTSHLAGVQKRLRAAELSRAAESARAEEAIVRVAAERRARRSQVGLAASLLVLTTLGGLGTTYVLQQRSARAAAVERRLAQATALLAEARKVPENPDGWRKAVEAARDAAQDDVLTTAEGRSRLEALETEGRAGLEAAERDQDLLAAVAEIRLSSRTEAESEDTEAAYARAFREAGLDLDALGPAELGAELRARPASVALGAAAALDDWALARIRGSADLARRRPLLEAARVADPDPFRDRVRAALLLPDRPSRQEAMQRLAADPQAAGLPPASAVLLGGTLLDAEAAVAVLRAAAARHPDDVAVNFTLAERLGELRPPPRDEQVRYYAAARALRPTSSHALAHVLDGMGRTDEALAVYNDLVARRPDDYHHLVCYEGFLNSRGRSESAAVLDRALAACRAAIRLRPEDADARSKLGSLLGDRVGDYPAAEAEFRAVIQRRPDDANAHHNLGYVLQCQEKLDEAIAAYREAVRLDPDSAAAHGNLGALLGDVVRDYPAAEAELRAAIRLRPDDAKVHSNLGALLCDVVRDYPAAEAEFRAAIRLAPDDATAHFNLGNALKAQGRLVEAVAAYRAAIRLAPDDAKAHFNLGKALTNQGKADEAIAAYREGVRLEPDSAAARNNLGTLLYNAARDYPAAEAEFRAAIRLAPEIAVAHINLGNVLGAQGRIDEAIVAHREAARLDPDNLVVRMKLGAILCDVVRDYPAAEAEFRVAVHLRPDDANAHNCLGNALGGQNRLAEAEAAYREAIRIQPDHAGAHCNLGRALQRQGRYAEALAELRTGHALGTKQPGWPYPSAAWVAEAERLAALAERLPAVLDGEAGPADATDRLALAQVAYDTRRYAGAARLSGEALESDPNLADDLKAAHRYNAACAAALGGCGGGTDAPAEPDARATLRRRALDWLRADLALRRKQWDDGEASRQEATGALRHWRQDKDLAGVRDADALAKLPEAERQDWEALWAEVQMLQAR